MSTNSLFRFAALTCLTSLFLAAEPSTPTKIKRLYIAPFTTTSSAQKLHDDLISALRKNPSVQIATNESKADATLAGGGQIWIKGYRSLNPRSGRLTYNASPIYDGYLSVELKDARGITFWSDLLTPSPDSENVSGDLAKRIAKQVATALESGEPSSFIVPLSPPKSTLEGAGATFPQPVYAKWFTNYRHADPNLAVNYQAIGSEAGIRKLLAGSIDFGASDTPEAIRDLAPDQQSRYLLFPSVVGAVVPIVNLPGLSSNISLTSEILAGIYLGKITKWNDPAIKAVNRGLHLPDLDIIVVHRADGSGTSYAFTDYLSKTNPEWKAQVGVSLIPKWPVGKSASGNDGVATTVKEFGGAIGYVEFIYALQNRLSFTKLKNQNNEFVSANLESMEAAAASAVTTQGDFKFSIVNAPGPGAYPISSFTWLVVPAKIDNDTKREAVKNLLRWILGPGQTQAAALGYLALPTGIVQRERSAIDKIL